MDADTFVSFAFRGFSLGFGIGFLLWALSYTVKVFRKSVIAGMRILDV